MKKISMYLVLILVTALAITGCSNKDEKSSSTTKENEPYEVTMAFPTFSNMTDVEDVQAEINKISKQKINATVKLTPVSIGAWQQQSNLLLTGSEKVDLILSSSIFGAYSTEAIKGQYLPLDELLESHGQGILEVMPEHILEGNKVNGQIYGIPSTRDWASYYGFIARKDIVDKYNIDLTQVKEWADLEDVFKIIKENEPTMIPLVATSSGGTLVSVITGGKYDVLGDYLGVMSFDNPGEIINLFEAPEYIAAADMVRDWYKKGYIMKDAATSTEANASIVAAGKGFGYLSHMKPGFEEQESKMTGTEMIAIPLTGSYSYTDSATGVNLSISRNTQNKEKTMEFLNLLYTDAEVMNLLVNGIEGRHYVVNNEGTLELPEGVTESSYAFNAWMVGNNFLTTPWAGDGPDLWDRMKEFNDSATLSPAYGFSYNPDPVKTEIAATTNVLNEFRSGIETGTLDPDKSFPEFNKKLKAAGLEKIMAEKQKQFDEWKANKQKKN